MNPPDKRIESLLRRTGTARSRELVAAGLSRMDISRRVASGRLVRLARGVYALPDHDLGEHHDLLAVARRAPGVVFCLLTALRIHDLTTQAPFEVWIAIGNKDHVPRIDHPPLRAVRLSPASLAAGVEKRTISGTPVKVTSAAKTVVDCFKFRSKVGLDVALEALRDARRSRKARSDEIWRLARINRVANVMRPYLEAVA